MVAVAILGIASITGVLWSMRSQPLPVAAAVAEHESVDPAPARMQLDLNAATTDQLNLLPGIGPTLAQRIVEYRDTNGPYQNLKDLDDVKGIGPKTLAHLEEWVIIEGP